MIWAIFATQIFGFQTSSPPPLLSSNRVASGWAGQRCLPTPRRSGAAGCCRAGSGAAGCCRFFCGAGTGAAGGCCLGSGVSGTGPGSGTGRFRSPPGSAQPPPLPPWAGRAGAGARQCDTGRQGSAWGRPPGAPRAAQGCGSPPAAPRGGALEPGLHPASAVIGRGGRPTPRSRTCICGRGWGRAQPEIWAGTLLRGSHIGQRPRSFRRAAIRWGGRGG